MPPLRTTVLVDETFFNALLRHDEPCHADATACYEELVAAYDSGTTVIVTHTDALAATIDPDRARQVAAICGVMPIDADVRRDIRRIRSNETAPVVAELGDSQLATIVLLARRRLDELVSFDPVVRRLAAAQRCGRVALGRVGSGVGRRP